MHSCNPHPHHDETLLQNLRNNPKQSAQKMAMERVREIIFKLAETHPNALLTTAGKALVRDRLNTFDSQYKTPDHPPYSAMIERALTELNEKKGSSEESISQFLQRTYSTLPLAHPAFLKHHLGKLCESGYIVATHGERYVLSTEISTLNPSMKVKTKRKRRKCRWAFEKERNKRQKKKRNQLKGKKVKAVEKHLESDEKEVQLIEYRIRNEGKQVEHGQMKRLLSFDKEHHVYSDPTISLTGVPYLKEKIQPDEKGSYRQDIGSSGTMGADVHTVCTPDQQELRQADYDLPILSTPERPPGFEFVRVENISCTETKATAVQELCESKRAMRQLRRWGKRLSERKPATPASTELVTSPKSEELHLPLVEPYQQRIVDLTPSPVEEIPHEKQEMGSLEADVVEVSWSSIGITKLKGDKIYCRRKNQMSRKPEIATTPSTKLVPPTELQCELFSKLDSQLSNEQEFQPPVQLPLDSKTEETLLNGNSKRKLQENETKPQRVLIRFPRRPDSLPKDRKRWAESDPDYLPPPIILALDQQNVKRTDKQRNRCRH